jgi:regulatory protein
MTFGKKKSYGGEGGFKPKKVKPPLDQAGLLEFAVRSLSSQMKSVRDLRRKMKTRAEPEEAGEAAMDAVIAKLKELGYLSDERFAADYTRLRKENEKYGKRRVQQGLMQKGIAQELTQSTLATARMTRWMRWRWRRSMSLGRG